MKNSVSSENLTNLSQILGHDLKFVVKLNKKWNFSFKKKKIRHKHGHFTKVRQSIEAVLLMIYLGDLFFIYRKYVFTSKYEITYSFP